MPIAPRRLRLLAAAREGGEGFVRLDPARLRFRLGTSLSDLRVPVELAEDASALVWGAASQLGLLLGTQAARHLPAEERDRLYLQEEYATLPAVADRLGPVTGGQDLRSAARAALAGHPALTGGLVTAWMGPGGKGRSLTALWIESLRRASAESAASPHREETPLVVALALSAALQEAVVGLRDVLPRSPHERWLRAAAVAGLWVSARTGLARFARDAGLGEEDPLLLRLEAMVNPAALAGRAGLLGGGLSLHGPELAAGIPRADELAARLAAGGDPAGAASEIAASLATDDEGSRRAEAAVALHLLREELVAAGLQAEEAGQASAAAELRALLSAPGALQRAVSDEAGRADLVSRLQRGPGRVLPAGAAHDSALRALAAWSPREPAAAFGLRRDQAREAYARGAAGAVADLALERMLAPARQALVPAAAGSRDAEWEAGRLYRIAARPGPILATARERPIGHLFADVKDFTRRTGMLGSAAMAEFLRREFYRPILDAARARHSGMEHLVDRGGVAVNNLLGDAISLSGDIESLVSLAAEVRRLLAAYEARLEREVSSALVAGRVAQIEERYEAELEQARAARDDARESAARCAAGSPEQDSWLRTAALHAAAAARLDDERLRELSRTRGEGLEAGVFVSHGPAPLVVEIDDDTFGAARVAIAEKINESARGTARAAPARARADQRLAAARAARGEPGLRHAWSVFIGQPLALELPPEAAEEALRAARAGDLDGAMRAVARPVRRALQAAARAEDEGSGDVYNAGAALSGEALGAWLDAVGNRRAVRRVELDPGDVPAGIARQWWFGEGPASLVVTFHPDGRPAEMFRLAGRARFKGLGEVPVWEFAADTGGPAALFRALGAAWFGAPTPSAGS